MSRPHRQVRRERLLLRRVSSEIHYRLTGRPRQSVDPFRPMKPDDRVPGAVLCGSPLIVATASTSAHPLGIASLLGPRLANADVLFVVYPTWTSEGDPVRAWKAVERVRFYRRRYPRHRFLFLANTEVEADLLRRFGGEPPLLAHQNIFLDETVFRPLPGATRDFDAVLNAKMNPFKRHALAREVERLAVISFDDAGLPPAERQAYAASVRRALAHATFANDLSVGAGAMLSREEVNRWLNRASVGLMLSAVEGGNFASTEYLLAGLPVVSTRSRGGRDRYFDAADCILTEADPREIAEAVTALKARNVPPESVRERVLKLIERDRNGFEEGVLAAARDLPNGDWAKLDMTRIKLLPSWRPVPELESEILGS
jgi:hypothetical protein